MRDMYLVRMAVFSALGGATAAACAGVPDAEAEAGERAIDMGYRPGAVSTGARALPEAAATTADAAFAAAVAGDQRSFLEATGETRPPITPPSAPSGPDVDACLDGSDAPGGKVFNRFLYCMTGDIRPTQVVFPLGTVGSADVDIQVVAYGRDDGQRNVKIFVRATRAVSGGLTGGPATVVRLWVDCADLSDAGCFASGATVAKTVGEWSNDRSWHEFTVESNENVASTVDKVLRHKWTIRSQARFPGGIISGGETDIASFPPRIIRCDSATYFRGRNAACIHDEVIPHLQYRTSDDKVDEVAFHILTAQENAAETWPDFGSAKRIPGKFIAGNASAAGLHRVRYGGADPYKKNVAKKNEACRRTGEYTGDRGLPPELYTPPAQQCDEYPFATTEEGAASAAWDFSVLGVTAADNRCAGLALQRYYLEDRILYNQDKFFVQIHSDGPPPVVEPPCVGEPGDFEDGAGPFDPEDN